MALRIMISSSCGGRVRSVLFVCEEERDGFVRGHGILVFTGAERASFVNLVSHVRL